MGQGPGQSRYAAQMWGSGATIIGFILVGLLPASLKSSPAKNPANSPLARPDIVFVQTRAFVPGPLAQRFPQGSRIVRLNSANNTGDLLPLTSEFFSAADPQVSFDATKILFSAEKSKGDRWQLWEMNLDGSQKRQITQCSENCLRGAYLPANEIAFTAEPAATNQTFSQLAVVNTDGSNFHIITFGTAPFQLETVLRDGRIVASAPWPLRDSPDATTRILYTLRPDGTALESFRCFHNDQAILTDVEELQDGSLVFIRQAILGRNPGGALVLVKQGALRAAPLAPLQAIYQSPRQFSDHELIVSRPTLAATNVPGRSDLYLLNLSTGALGPLIYRDSTLSSTQPVPVLPRPVPKHYWNTLNPESATGSFISLDSYSSADAANGRISTPISRVRVFALTTRDGSERDLGEAPVESDGSFFVKVPANAPIRFVLLDANGHTIREERSWVWARPGEQRGCTGCHGDKAVSPDNHWPLTLRRFDTPTPLGETEHAFTSPAK